MQFHILLLLCRSVGLPLVQLILSPVVYFSIFSFHSVVVHLCLYQISLSCLFTRPSEYSFPKTLSLHPPPPPCSHTHSVFKSKDSPCVMQAVSRRPPLSFCLPLLSFSPLSLSPPPPPSPECLDRSKWCDCDCSAGRLPLHVCLSASLESLT